MKIKIILVSILLLLFVVFTGGCLQFMEELDSITGPSLEVDRDSMVNYWAVIVGIEDYESMTDLSYTIDDAEDMRNVLLSYGNWDNSNIQFLTDVDASKSSIDTAIAYMASESDADDVCLFFFSGHGSRIPDDDDEEVDSYDEVICPYDTTYDTTEDLKKLEKETVISDDELGTWLFACSGNVIVILDTCMSGGFTKGIEETVKAVPNPQVPKDAIAKKHFGEGLVERLKQRPISRDLNKTGYVVLMACEEDKSAYESRRLKNGVFTYYIVEGLWGPADTDSDNNVSAEEDFYYADPLVLWYKPTNQDPQLWDGDEGEDLPLVIASTSVNGSMHVDSIDMSLKARGPLVNAIATVTIVDESGASVEGATVSGTWSGATTDTDSGITDGMGQVSLESDKVKNPDSGTTFTFTVDDVTKDGWTYDSGNSVTSGSITVPEE